MGTQLLEIQPRELKFIFELKKQSACSIRLKNNTHNYVAFKVKTTSPKKYCVRPNVGVISPNSECDFTVTMQAQREVSPDMTCKDKFLIQSAIVPAGTTDEDISASTFSRENGKYIEENKLKVILMSPPPTPVLSPVNGTSKHVSTYEEQLVKEPVFSRVGISTPVAVSEDWKSINSLNSSVDEDLKQVKDMIGSVDLKAIKEEEFQTNIGVSDKELKLLKDVDSKPERDALDIGEVDLRSNTALNSSLIDVGSKPNRDALDIGEVDLRTNSALNKSLMDVDSKPKRDALDIGEVEIRENTEFNSLKDGNFRTVKAVEELKLVGDIKEMKSKLNELESKLGKAEVTISKLTQERAVTIKESEKLREELALLRTRAGGRKVQVGFPFLFVCMVAFISVILGYLVRC